MDGLCFLPRAAPERSFHIGLPQNGRSHPTHVPSTEKKCNPLTLSPELSERTGLCVLCASLHLSPGSPGHPVNRLFGSLLPHHGPSLHSLKPLSACPARFPCPWFVSLRVPMVPCCCPFGSSPDLSSFERVKRETRQERRRRRRKERRGKEER